MDARIAVLASGAGTNLQALVDDPQVGRLVVLVVSDRPGAAALDRAKAHGIRTASLEPGNYRTREDRDHALTGILQEEKIGYVMLAGYMRILGPEVVRAFDRRILNVHPALLPAFPGAHAVRDALEWGVRFTGATVHMVDEEVDHGPIVLQEAVPVLPGDDEETLHARIQAAEHRLFPRAARLLVEGRLRVQDRVVRILEEGGGA